MCDFLIPMSIAISIFFDNLIMYVVMRKLFVNVRGGKGNVSRLLKKIELRCHLKFRECLSSLKLSPIAHITLQTILEKLILLLIY